MEYLTGLGVTVCLALHEVYAKCSLIVARLLPWWCKYIINNLFQKAGITIDGPEATDIQVIKKYNIYNRMATYREVGLMDAYVEGTIDIRDPLGFFVKIFRCPEMMSMMHSLNWVMHRFNLNSRKKTWEVGRVHYDIGNDLYEVMLGKYMQYSCGYWKDAKTLDEAQLAKMNLIAQKLHLEPGMRILDIGCGFGTLARHLAQNYGASIVGCTISKEQAKYAQELCKGLPVDIRLCDYRDINEKFDRIICIEMFQHVGPCNYRQFMKVAHRCLKDDGLLQLHIIGVSIPTSPRFVMWLHKTVFPNVQLSYYLEIAKAIEGLWVIEDWHNIGWHFADTFGAWHQNFEEGWPKLHSNYNDRFYRMWKLYLLFVQASFLARRYDYWHIVLSKDVRKQRYSSVR